jgi:predicted O-linked N-acetylglucosamine transferase (SPINDLY family)
MVDAGFAHHEAGELEQAAALYRKALEVDSEHPEALHLLGLVTHQQGNFRKAIELISRALPELDDLPEAHVNLGNALREVGRFSEAADSYGRAIAIDPDYGMAHSNLARALNDQGLFEEGLESSRRAIALIPDFLGAHVNCAAALMGLERFAEAEIPLRRAVALAPDKPEAHRDLGEILAHIGRLDEAAASYRRSLELNPAYAQAHRKLGNVLKKQGKLSEALASLERAIDLDPDDPDTSQTWFSEKLNICDWIGYTDNEARTRRTIAAQPSLGTPWTLLSLQSTPAEQLACARLVSDQVVVPEADLLPRRRPTSGKKIRLGYLSADFREHAVAFVIAGLIERHDRRRFDVIGYSCGPDDASPIRSRLAGAFDGFVDIRETSDRRAAESIQADGVDILVDLTGYTAHGRTAVLAHRPAPIQASYIGYSGTMGADFIDYILVDRFLVPPDQQPFFSERLVHLPDCYLCTDDRREIPERTPTRAESGLPEAGFVFCCFNNAFKITPAFFDVWMQLLRAVPGSVLWLLDANPLARANLAREATARGVAPERIVFAPRRPVAEHLARHRLADLFLDTLPYNAHVTTADALWAGLPVLTCPGNTFASRVAGSLLHAIGLDELVTTTLGEYEELALRLAREPGLLTQLRTRLGLNRRTHPLFDTARFTRNIESAYQQMWETWKAGRPPTAFAVSPSLDAGWLTDLSAGEKYNQTLRPATRAVSSA